MQIRLLGYKKENISGWLTDFMQYKAGEKTKNIPRWFFFLSSLLNAFKSYFYLRQANIEWNVNVPVALNLLGIVYLDRHWGIHIMTVCYYVVNYVGEGSSSSILKYLVITY